MRGITTHILDIFLGRPAAGIGVRLEKFDEDSWLLLTESATDGDGRCRTFSPEPASGIYRLTFSTGPYFRELGRTTLYPEISVTFECNGDGHYHLPLLLSDNSYTVYRG